MAHVKRTCIFAIAIVIGISLTCATSTMAQPENTLLGVNCAAPPLWHCPDTECLSSVVTQPGSTVEPKTRRTFFLDCPSDYSPGNRVSILMSLHGGGSYANWQRNYFPVVDVKDKHSLVVITPRSPYRFWEESDDQYLQNIIDLVVAAVGKESVERFILAGHSQGGGTARRLVCTDYFRDKVDVRISLSGGRVGPVTRSGDRFGFGLPPVYMSGDPGVAEEASQPPRLPRRQAASPPGGACDYSFIFTKGEYESIPEEESPLAEKFDCDEREELAEVVDPKPGYVWDPSRQDPGSDGWGHYPKSGRAKVYHYPNCRDNRVVADVVRLQKGHTEGLEPNVTDRIVQLAVSAKGGKIAEGSWAPPPLPPPRRSMFGR